MLFKLQILSLSLEPGIPFKAKDERPRNIFLDLWSQGQPKRYLFNPFNRINVTSFIIS
jgi:hypothetical protein